MPNLPCGWSVVCTNIPTWIRKLPVALWGHLMQQYCVGGYVFGE